MEMNTEYQQGFIDRCNARGVDPELVMKSAGMFTQGVQGLQQAVPAASKPTLPGMTGSGGVPTTMPSISGMTGSGGVPTTMPGVPGMAGVAGMAGMAGPDGVPTTMPGGAALKPKLGAALSLIVEKQAATDRLKDTVGNISGVAGGLAGAGMGNTVGVMGGLPLAMSRMGRGSPMKAVALAGLLGTAIGGVGGALGGRAIGRAVVPKPEPTLLDKLKSMIQSTGTRIQDSLPER